MSGLELTNPKEKAVVSVKLGLDSCPRQVSTSGSIYFVLPICNCDDACFNPALTEVSRLGLFSSSSLMILTMEKTCIYMFSEILIIIQAFFLIMFEEKLCRSLVLPHEEAVNLR